MLIAALDDASSLTMVQSADRSAYMDETNIIGAFSEEQAARLSGVSLNQLRRWDSDGFFTPSFRASQPHVPYGRIYSFRDIVSLRVLNDLRNRKKIPLQHLRQVSEKLSHLGDAKWSAATLYVLGKRVVFEDPRTHRRHEVVSGQHVLDIPLRVVIASTKQAISELNSREDQVGKIVQFRFVSQNEPVIAGTRIPVASVRDFAESGYSSKQIIREYPDLTEADIRAALAFKISDAA